MKRVQRLPKENENRIVPATTLVRGGEWVEKFRTTKTIGMVVRKEETTVTISTRGRPLTSSFRVSLYRSPPPQNPQTPPSRSATDGVPVISFITDNGRHAHAGGGGTVLNHLSHLFADAR